VVPLLIKIFSEDEREDWVKESKEHVKILLRLFGRFCPYKGFSDLIHSILNLELSQNEDNLSNGLQAYRYLIEGHLEALPEGEGLLDKSKVIEDVFDKLGDLKWLDNLSRYTLPQFQSFMSYVLSKINDIATEEELDKVMFSKNEFVARICLSILSMPIYSLIHDSGDQQNIKLIKKSIGSM